MEMFYFMVFGGLAAVVAVLKLSKSSRDRVNTPSAFNAFKNNYLLVYSLMMAGDWLQGPYVYYLYSQYGYDSCSSSDSESETAKAPVPGTITKENVGSLANLDQKRSDLVDTDIGILIGIWCGYWPLHLLAAKLLH